MTYVTCVVCGTQLFVKNAPKASSKFSEEELADCCERCEHAYDHVSTLRVKLHNSEREVLQIQDAGKLALAVIGDGHDPAQMPPELMVKTEYFQRLWEALNLSSEDYPDNIKFQRNRWAQTRIMRAAQDLFDKNPTTNLISLAKTIMYYKQTMGWTDGSFAKISTYLDVLGVKYDNLTGHEDLDNEKEVKNLVKEISGCSWIDPN